MGAASFTALDLGIRAYAPSLEAQREHHASVLASRDSGKPEVGRLLLVEHAPPVITISRRPDARKHLTATPEMLAAAGVEVCETDRGGDITYHGPGQLVAYPIIDLNTLGLNLHGYMRLLEEIIITTLAQFNVKGVREPGATGVWTRADEPRAPASGLGASRADEPRAQSIGTKKICAMGVRVKRWVTMHGLALNVTTNLDHFGLIVPCGLAGRDVTSLQQLLGDRCPSLPSVKQALIAEFERSLTLRGTTPVSDRSAHLP